MDLKHLRYFITVAEELNFTRAAARLRMSQPPLSQMIRRMEDEVGFKLFERTKRKVVLTEAGRALFDESRSILSIADQAVKNARRVAKGQTGYLRVAFIPWADFTTVFSEAFRRLGSVSPDVTVDFHSLPASASMEALEEGRIDLAFVTDPPTPPRGTEYALVQADELVVALPVQHELVDQELILLESLAHYPHIVVSQDRIGTYHSVVHSLCMQCGFELKPRHIIDHPQTTLALVAAGAGISLVPASYQNLKRPGVVYRQISPSVQIKLIAAWKGDNRMPVLRIFIEILKEARNIIG